MLYSLVAPIGTGGNTLWPTLQVSYITPEGVLKPHLYALQNGWYLTSFQHHPLRTCSEHGNIPICIRGEDMLYYSRSTYTHYIICAPKGSMAPIMYSLLLRLLNSHVRHLLNDR